jgi:hypothetical protein
MLNRKLIATCCLTSAVALSASPIALAAAHTQRVSTDLTVLAQAKPSCHGKVCTIRNHGAGTMAGFGKVTFTTVITDDTSMSPCPNGSYVPRLRRTINTAKGTLVMNEAGFVCPEPKIGPRVDLVWVADSAHSTGVFSGAHGTGVDHAELSHNTATESGTLTLAG